MSLVKFSVGDNSSPTCNFQSSPTFWRPWNDRGEQVQFCVGDQLQARNRRQRPANARANAPILGTGTRQASHSTAGAGKTLYSFFGSIGQIIDSISEAASLFNQTGETPVLSIQRAALRHAQGPACVEEATSAWRRPEHRRGRRPFYYLKGRA
ncbi:MAG: hypothetical protein D0530_00115 [Methylococcales bacterium]|nr:MAG: hypothetical protein D0530_00115 [Methylococcales bacterium]